MASPNVINIRRNEISSVVVGCSGTGTSFSTVFVKVYEVSGAPGILQLGLLNVVGDFSDLQFNIEWTADYSSPNWEVIGTWQPLTAGVGFFPIAESGFFRLNCVDFTGGTSVDVSATVGLPAGSVTGGGGSGDVTIVGTTVTLPVSITGQPIAVTGSFSNPSVGITGDPVPLDATFIGYQDGSGNLVAPSALAPFPVTVISGGGSPNVNLIEVGGSPITLGQALDAASLPVVLPADQITALTPPTAAAIGTAVSGDLLVGQQLAAGSVPVVLPATQITTLTPPTAAAIAAAIVANPPTTFNGVVTNAGIFAVQDQHISAASAGYQRITDGTNTLFTSGFPGYIQGTVSIGAGPFAVSQSSTPWIMTGTDADNATNSISKLPVIPARANASTPSWTEGHEVPLSTDLNGNLRVSTGTVTVTGTVSATQGTSPWVVSLASTTITGTVSVTQGTSPWVVAGNLTHNNAAPTTNNLGVLSGIANAAAPSFTEGDQVLLSTDLTGNLRVTSTGSFTGNITQWDTTALGAPTAMGVTPSGNVIGVNNYPVSVLSTGTVINSTNGTLNATFAIPVGGSQAILVQLDQTTTIVTGTIRFQVSYDGTNFVNISTDAVIDPTSATNAAISLPYTLQANTKKPFLLFLKGAQALQILVSQALTGTGTVTPFVTQLSSSALQEIVGTVSVIGAAATLAATVQVLGATGTFQGTWTSASTLNSVFAATNPNASTYVVGIINSGGSYSTGAVTFEASMDGGTTFQPVNGVNVSTGAQAPSTLTLVSSALTNIAFNVVGLAATGFRIRLSTAITGTGSTDVRIGQNLGAVTNTNTNLVSVGGTALTATSSSLNVNVTNTVPVSGTVAVTQSTSPWVVSLTSTTITGSVAVTNAGTFAVQDTVLDAALIAQEATTSGVKGLTAFGAVTTAAPSYSTTKSDALSLTTAGGLRTDQSSQAGTAITVTPVAFGTGTPSGNAPGVNAGLFVGVTPVRSNQTTTATGVVDVNNVGIDGVTIVTAASGVQKVGIVGNAGAAMDAAIGTAPTNALGAMLFPATTGGCSSAVSQALTTTINVKSTAGQLYGYMVSNTNAAVVYLMYYNTTTTPGTIGSTTNLLMEIGIPAGSAANVSFDNGIAFSSGIAVAVATTATGNTAPGTGLTITTIYK